MGPTSASPCTCFRLRRASRQLARIYDGHLAPAALSLNACSILRRALARRPRMTAQPVLDPNAVNCIFHDHLSAPQIADWILPHRPLVL